MTELSDEELRILGAKLFRASMLLCTSRKAGLVRNGSSGQKFETHRFSRCPRKVTIVSVHLPDS